MFFRKQYCQECYKSIYAMSFFQCIEWIRVCFYFIISFLKYNSYHCLESVMVQVLIIYDFSRDCHKINGKMYISFWNIQLCFHALYFDVRVYYFSRSILVLCYKTMKNAYLIRFIYKYMQYKSMFFFRLKFKYKTSKNTLTELRY